MRSSFKHTVSRSVKGVFLGACTAGWTFSLRYDVVGLSYDTYVFIAYSLPGT